MPLIDSAHYPALGADPQVIHLDASASMPLHEDVIAKIENFLRSNLGTHQKAQYDGALQATGAVQRTRRSIARHIGAQEDEIFFVTSASAALKDIYNTLSNSYPDGAVYSPEDHTSVAKLFSSAHVAHQLTYTQTGVYDLFGLSDDVRPYLLYAVQVHSLYGGDNDISLLRRLFPESFLLVDASQSIGRTTVNVSHMKCDALVFSSQKIGGIAGAGVLYLSKKHHPRIIDAVEPNTAPLPAIMSMGYALDIIEEKGIHAVDMYLAKMTEYFIYAALERVSAISFVKGPAFSEYSCGGNGIVSFKIDGYSSQDVSMILNDSHINVRAADHCVEASSVDRDVVRISMHVYTSTDDLDRLIDILSTL